jgi:hypothetical protein
MCPSIFWYKRPIFKVHSKYGRERLAFAVDKESLQTTPAMA